MGPCGESVQRLSWQQLKDDDDNGGGDDDYHDDNDTVSSYNMKIKIVLSLLDLFKI